MLYELVGIARCAGSTGGEDAAQLVRLAGRLIVNNRGVVRKIENWGVRPLPKITNINRQSHVVASHFYVKFDASPSVQSEVMRALRRDPRLLRTTVVKLGGNR
jgi:small subunit ribosomal protein S6